MSASASPVTGRPTVRYWVAASLVAAVGTIAWCATGIASNDGPDHLVGPYRIGLALEYLVGGIAVAAGLAGLVASVRLGRAARGLSRSAAVLLIATAIIAAGLWRVITAGGWGANIGGGMAAFFGPVLIAGSVFLALCAERYNGGIGTRTFVALSVIAWTSAPILIAIGLRFI